MAFVDVELEKPNKLAHQERRADGAAARKARKLVKPIKKVNEAHKYAEEKRMRQNKVREALARKPKAAKQVLKR